MPNKDYLAAMFMFLGALMFGYNAGSMAKTASLNSSGQQVAVEVQSRGAR
jgi:hypothetical protein